MEKPSARWSICRLLMAGVAVPPVLVADQESDRAQDFDVVDPEIAQLPILELYAQRPRGQHASWNVGLLGAA